MTQTLFFFRRKEKKMMERLTEFLLMVLASVIGILLAAWLVDIFQKAKNRVRRKRR